MKARVETLGWRGLAIALGTWVSLQAVAYAQSEVYEFDKAHSSPTFTVRHLFTPVSGHFKDFTGTVQWNAADPTKSSVEITIQTASIDTGNEKRDGHLRTADFFDAEKNPTITFKSTKIEPTDVKDHYKVTGDLTMRGVTKPVVVDLEALGFADLGQMGKRGGFHATAKINRQDWGVSWNRKLDNGGVLVSDEVAVDFPVEAVKKASS